MRTGILIVVKRAKKRLTLNTLACYLAAIPLAFVNQWIADALYIVVAAIWLIPDKRIESRISASLSE